MDAYDDRQFNKAFEEGMKARYGKDLGNLIDDFYGGGIEGQDVISKMENISEQIDGLSSKPTYLNTGVVNPAMLQAVTDRQRLRLDIEALEYLDITDGYITYEKSDARVYNCHIKPSAVAVYGLQEAGTIPEGGFTGLLFEDCEIGGGVNNFGSAPVIGRGWTLRRCYLHQSDGDGIKAQGNNIIEDCFITDIGKDTADSHADGLQMVSGSNVLVKNCFFDMPALPATNLSNAFVILKTDVGDISDVTVDGCYFKGNFDGPNYAIYLYEENGNTVRNVEIKNCIFEIGLNPVRILAIQGSPEYTWENNKWSDGTPIPDPFA